MEARQASPLQESEKTTKPGVRHRLTHIAAIFRAKDVQVPKHEPCYTVVVTEGESTSGTPSVTSSTISGDQGAKEINGHQALQIAGNSYMLPTMTVPAEYKDAWHSQLESRLRDDLAHWLEREWCHLEFSMIQDKSGKVGPCIVLVCWDDKTCVSEKGKEIIRKNVTKKLRKLQSLRDCQFPCKVMVAKVSLLAIQSSLPATSAMSIETRAQDLRQTRTSLLIRNSNDTRQECTLGGFVRIGSTIYGLTVAHPFVAEAAAEETYGSVSGASCFESDDGDESDSDESLFGDVGSDRLGMSTDDIQASPPASRQGTDDILHSLCSLDESVSYGSVKEEINHVTAYTSIGHISATSFDQTPPQEGSHELDWALIALDVQPHRLQNTYIIPGSSKAIKIVGVLLENPEPSLKVVVLGGRSGLQSAVVGQEKINLRLRGRNFVVTQLVLTGALEPGDSGSWVIQEDGMVVGSIVAGAGPLPIAYMVPMNAMLQDLAQALGGCQTVIVDDNVAEMTSTTAQSWKTDLPSNNFAESKTPAGGELDHHMIEGKADAACASTATGQDQMLASSRLYSPPSKRFTSVIRQDTFRSPLKPRHFRDPGLETTKDQLYFHFTGSPRMDIRGLRSEAWEWVSLYLVKRAAQVWTDIMVPTLVGLDHGPDPYSLQSQRRLYQVMVRIADLIGNEKDVSLRSMTEKLIDEGLIRAEAGSLAIQMVFQVAGWLTALWDPVPDVSTKRLTLRNTRPQTRRYLVSEKRILETSSIDFNATQETLHRALTRFGTLLPTPEHLRRDDPRGGLECGSEHITEYYVSYTRLVQCLKVKIEWTDTLNQHLEFEKRSRTLQVFRHPSLCLLMYRNQRGSLLSKVLRAQMDEDYGNALPYLKALLPNVDFDDFLVEVLLSYRLIFGQSYSSRNRMKRLLTSTSREVAGNECFDPLLWPLCTEDESSPKVKQLNQILEARRFDQYIAFEEFPFLAARLLRLQKAVLARNPHSWSRLWYDRRNPTAWFTTWAIVIVGGGIFIFQMLQLILQIYTSSQGSL